VIRPVTPGFFETIGVRLLRGRGIEATDLEGTEGVAVVNETFVAQNFPNEDPIGREFGVTASFGWKPESFRIVGVVADIRHRIREEPVPAVYPAHTQFGPGYMTVHVRGRGGMATLLPAVRDAVHELDSSVPLARVETVAQAFDRATAETRFYLGLVTAFAALAVMMAGVGLYGVVSFLVSKRTREIGIRVALGAATSRVRRFVILQGLIPAVWGLAVGLAVAWLLGGYVADLLYEVDARDPLVLGAVAVFLLLVTVAATVVPARRATRLDPSEALRAE
jgi:predicted permease